MIILIKLCVSNPNSYYYYKSTSRGVILRDWNETQKISMLEADKQIHTKKLGVYALSPLTCKHIQTAQTHDTRKNNIVSINSKILMIWSISFRFRLMLHYYPFSFRRMLKQKNFMLVIWFQKENVTSVKVSIDDWHSTRTKIWERRNHIIEDTISLQDFNYYADSLFPLWRYMNEATSFQPIYVLIWHLNTSQDYWSSDITENKHEYQSIARFW